MKQSHAYISTAILLSSSSLLAAPISAVIGLDNSQIIENSQTLSLLPNTGTLLPLQGDFSPITRSQTGSHGNWLNQIGNKIRIEHKQRELSYTGTLVSIGNDAQSFLIDINDRLTSLPLNDFYLIPHEKSKEQEASGTTYPISYQTNQLSWTPQLNLILENGYVSVSQQAMLHNNSNSKIEIQDSVLHYSRTEAPQTFKIERSALAMDSSRPEVSYQDNEISFSLDDKNLTLAPYSNLLYALPSSKNPITSQTHVANLYTHNNSTGTLNLSFNNHINFSFEKDGLPGQYKIFWKKDKLLIPANTVTLDTVREGHSTDIITNKSQDLTGDLTLINSTSKKYPSIQTWQATIENHSDQTQNYSVEQNTNGIIKILEGADVEQINASGLKLSGKIEAHTKKTIIYKIELNN
jgi:hypothetical protein